MHVGGVFNADEDQPSWLDGIGDRPEERDDAPLALVGRDDPAATSQKSKRKSAPNPDAVKERPSSPEDDDDEAPDAELLSAMETPESTPAVANDGAANVGGGEEGPRRLTRRSLNPEIDRCGDGGKKRPSAVSTSPMDIDLTTPLNEKDEDIRVVGAKNVGEGESKSLPAKTPRQTTRSAAAKQGQSDNEDEFDEAFCPNSQKHFVFP